MPATVEYPVFAMNRCTLVDPNYTPKGESYQRLLETLDVVDDLLTTDANPKPLYVADGMRFIRPSLQKAAAVIGYNPVDGAYMYTNGVVGISSGIWDDFPNLSAEALDGLIQELNGPFAFKKSEILQEAEALGQFCETDDNDIWTVPPPMITALWKQVRASHR